jgi:hypothetical protein
MNRYIIGLLLIGIVVVATLWTILSPIDSTQSSETRYKLHIIEQILVECHRRGVKLDDFSSLHSLLIYANQQGLIDSTDLSQGAFEKDAWGNPLNWSCEVINRNTIITISSHPPITQSSTSQLISLSVHISATGDFRISRD